MGWHVELVMIESGIDSACSVYRESCTIIWVDELRLCDRHDIVDEAVNLDVVPLSQAAQFPEYIQLNPSASGEKGGIAGTELGHEVHVAWRSNPLGHG